MREKVHAADAYGNVESKVNENDSLLEWYTI